MFVGVVALRYKNHIRECHNSHKHSQRPLTKYRLATGCLCNTSENASLVLFISMSSIEMWHGVRLIWRVGWHAHDSHTDHYLLFHVKSGWITFEKISVFAYVWKWMLPSFQFCIVYNFSLQPTPCRSCQHNLL